jgi:hypothetical protein
MEANPSISPESSTERLENNWRELYVAALFETNRSLLPARIENAELAIRLRSRQLFASGKDTIDEDQVLDDALYALKALRNCTDPDTIAA